MSLPVKRRDCDYTVYDGYSREWIKVNSALVIVDKHDLDQLEACLLNTQRTVQAFRVLLQEAQCANDNNYFAYLHESDKRLSANLALHNAERERDNARAALVQAQELNATLTEKLRSHQRMAASGVYIKTAEYAAECSERRDLRRQLEEMTKDRDAQRIVWNAAESKMWLGELREQLAIVTAERDALIDKLAASKEALTFTIKQQLFGG